MRPPRRTEVMAAGRNPQEHAESAVCHRAVLEEHRSSPLTGMCVSCGEPGPCRHRREAATDPLAAMTVAELISVVLDSLSTDLPPATWFAVIRLAQLFGISTAGGPAPPDSAEPKGGWAGRRRRHADAQSRCAVAAPLPPQGACAAWPRNTRGGRAPSGAGRAFEHSAGPIKT
jgi:hypothetical protein